MRDWLIIISIIVIIVCGEIMMQNYLNQTANELINNLNELKDKTIIAKKTENREEIINKVNEIEKKWEKINKTWTKIIVHQELDNIQQALIRTKSNMEEGSFENAFQEIDTALFFVEHVKQREKISLKNIF